MVDTDGMASVCRERLPSAFHQRAAAAALTHMFRSSKFFSICTLDAVADTLGLSSGMAGPDYSALRALHTVDWAEMGRELQREVYEKCLQLLGLPLNIVEMAEEVWGEGAARRSTGGALVPHQPPHTPWRLRFWRR